MNLIKRNRRTAWRRVDDEVIIVSSETNALTILNDSAGRIWELLEAPRSQDDLVTALVDEFDVDSEQARRDVSAFVADLESSSLLDLSDG